MNKTSRSLNVLHILLSIGETSAPYNEHCLSMADERKIAICTYFRNSSISPPPEITLFEGNDSLKGFFRALKAALAEKEYDIIHTHSPHVGFLFLLATALKPAKYLPITVHTVHSSFQNYRRLRIRLMLIPVFTFFQRVVCCGQASFESVPTFYKWLAGDRLCAVQNGVDMDRVDHTIGNKRQYCHNGHFTIATVGRLIEIKNPLSVLNAFQQSADQAACLVFIGEGNLRDLILTHSKTFGLEKQVDLRGLIPREKVYQNLAKTDLYVSASRVEGIPVSVLEAMSCRCPVLLSDIPSHREIAEGVDFIPLIQPDDVAGFTREIERFKQMSPSERADIGEKCRKLVEERFSLAKMHRGYAEVYAQVLGQY